MFVEAQGVGMSMVVIRRCVLFGWLNTLCIYISQAGDNPHEPFDKPWDICAGYL